MLRVAPEYMYGTEDAVAVWKDTWTDHVKQKPIQMGSARSALFAVPDLRDLCHGDDFLLVAERRELEEFGAHLSAKFEMRKMRGGDGNLEANSAAQPGPWGY